MGLQYYRDEQALYNNNNIIDFTANNNNNSISFKFKEKATGQTGNDGTKEVNIMTPLKDLSKFCRTLEMTLINCEVNLILTWYINCLVTGTMANQVLTFTITDTKLYVPVVNLFAKLLEQLKSGFKRTINWNIYQSKVTTQP